MECKNTRYVMRRNLQLLNVEHVWIYVYIMNSSRLGFHDVSCGVHIFTSSERFTMRQDLLFFSSTSHQVSKKRFTWLLREPSYTFCLFLTLYPILCQHRKNARVSSCF